MIGIFIFLCITAVISADRSAIHKQMTDEEIVLTFGNDIETVPEYEVVPVKHATHPNNPNHRILELTSFSREMRLYLEPTDGYLAGVNTPVFKARHNPKELNNVEFEKIPGAISKNHKMYQDPVNNAAVVIKHDHKGFPLIHGIINYLKDSFVIRPLLPRFEEFFKLHKRDAKEFSNRTLQYPDLEDTHHHVIYKLPKKNDRKLKHDDYVDEDNDYSHEFNDIPEDDNHFEVTRNDIDVDEHRELESDEQLVGDEAHGHVDLVAFGRGKRKRWQGNNQVPDIVYPQVLIIVESSFFEVFKRDVSAIIEYILAYWNGVDLRYRAYLKPDMRLNIAGIILAEDASMTPYIKENNIHIKGYHDKINVTKALREKAQFMYPETVQDGKTLMMKRLGFKFDFVITMTTMDMCQFPRGCSDEKTHDYTCSIYKVNTYCRTLGFAFYTGACAYDGDYKEMEGVGIVEDRGDFGGVVPTAHEVGHLLGASHDQHNMHGCDWDDGYIMSYRIHAKQESFVWSNCSAESVKYFLKKESRAQCMFDKPDTGNEVPRLLPGKVYSRDEVCDRAVGTSRCDDSWYNQQCVNLYCKPKNPKSKSKCEAVQNHLVPEGSSCGKGYACINGYCINENNGYVHLELGTTTPTTTTTEEVLTEEDRYMTDDENDFYSQ